MLHPDTSARRAGSVPAGSKDRSLSAYWLAYRPAAQSAPHDRRRRQRPACLVPAAQRSRRTRSRCSGAMHGEPSSACRVCALQPDRGKESCTASGESSAPTTKYPCAASRIMSTLLPHNGTKTLLPGASPERGPVLRQQIVTGLLVETGLAPLPTLDPEIRSSHTFAPGAEPCTIQAEHALASALDELADRRLQRPLRSCNSRSTPRSWPSAPARCAP